MKRLKIISIIGTRPEATKMAPLILELNKNKYIDSILCVTAQHREMLDQVLTVFDLKPDYDLNIMKMNQTLTDITVNALKGLEDIFIKEKPDLIVVHGDTTTTLAGTLAGFYQQIPVAHVEAGLRTFNNYEPFPEEVNRKLTGAIATMHLSPTKLSKENLLKENIDSNNIYITGNTAVDCLKTTITDSHIFKLDLLNNIDFQNKRVITMTAHRRENLGKPLTNICNAINRITKKYDDVIVIYVVHFNPLVQKVASDILGNNENVHLIQPIDMVDMHNLINKSYIILTDSGGLQEESPSLNVPVLVLRNVTERPEGIEAGTLKIAGVEEQSIFEMTCNLLDNKEEYDKMACSKNPYGDGNASNRIVNAILYHFKITKEKPKDYIV
jgi:UDP-N-acetylglucosamine 2-epimerase (non-hydrolysing)